MIEIPLTQGQTALIDDEDYDTVSKYRWSALWSDDANTWYAICILDRHKVVRRKFSMHRMIMQQTVGSGTLVDHIDHNGLHNYRGNLRVCSKAQNQYNMRKHLNTSSSFKGVSWDSWSGKWRAGITKDYQSYKLGRFSNEVDAAKAYNEAALEMFGDFALLNEVGAN